MKTQLELPDSLKDISIEPLLWEDIPAVSEVDVRAFPLAWHENAFRNELLNRCANYLVARFNGTIIGFAGSQVVMDECHITTIAVDPEFQGMGIGTLLFVSLLHQAVQAGAARATLEVRQGNKSAKKLYAKVGFVEVSVRKQYYSDNNEDAAVMWVDGMRSEQFRQRLISIKAALGLEG